MAKLLRSGQVFYPRLFRVKFPGMQVKYGRAALFVDFPHAIARVGVRKQAKITTAAKRKTPPVHLQHAHGKLVKLIRDLVGAERSVRDAVVWMKTYRENRRIVDKAVLFECWQGPVFGRIYH